MIKNFFKRNSKSTSESVEHNDERLALTALLIKIAKSDYEYSSVEKSRIKIILKKRFLISELEVTDLINKAELLEDESSDSVRFTKVIKEFVKNRFNNSLASIGITKIFEIDAVLLSETDWFDDEIIGTKHGDFFVKRSINYSKRTKSITSDDLF